MTVGAIQSRVGKAATEGPPQGRGLPVQLPLGCWGAGALLSASVDTLCLGQSPFQKRHRALGECYGSSGPA